jgi:tripartite ATP-independent transporter DctP family solute receptor
MNVVVKAAEPHWKGRQFHVLPERSHQHRFLVELWEGVRAETDGKLAISVHPMSGGEATGGPAALDMLKRGEVEFYTINGNSLGVIVPPAEVQGVPYAFPDSAAVHRASDGALGAYISRECAARGIYRFPRGLMENGFRQTYTKSKAIRTVADFAGLRIRVPGPSMIMDVSAALGATPVPVVLHDIPKALAEGRVDGHENPLIVMDVQGLHEVTPQVSLTRHMWTGFNVVGNLKFWQSLPEDIQAIVDRHVTKAVAAQRAYTQHMNDTLADVLAGRGMTITRTDTESCRRRLVADGFYARWKEKLGTTAWSLLEDEVGRIG